MSDPVTNVEIEDVLSSIRRLVAEGDRGQPAEPADTASADTQPVEKFVLTPALRVTQNADTEDLAPQDTSAQVEAPLVLEPQAAEASASEEAPRDTDPSVLLLKDHDVSASRESLEATIAELEAAVTAQPDEFEPDGSETRPEISWENVGFLRAVPDVHSQGDAETDDAENSNDAPEDAEDVAGPELVVAHSDTLSQTAQAAAVLKAAQVSFRRGGGRDDVDTDYGDQLAETKTADAQLESYLEGGHAIDEETLRKLVVDVVREELQGELGERITRNVRKLVRREIHRVLTTEDFT